MRLSRILGHALVLALVNLGSIFLGFGAYHLSGSPHQILVQVPVAALASVLGFLAWTAAVYRGPLSAVRLGRPADALLVYLAAWPWACLIFTTAHHLSEGYLTSAGNLWALGLFQAAVNLLVLAACAPVMRGRAVGA